MERRGSEGMKGGEGGEGEKDAEIGWTEGLVSPQAERKRKSEGWWRRGGGMSGRERDREKKDAAAAAAFVKRCQIFNPRVLSVLLCNRWWGPHRPRFTRKYTQVNTQSLSPVSFVVLFLYRLNEYFITSNINIHSNGFAHSYYRYFPFFFFFSFFKQKYSLQILHNQALK